jgi:O-antigen ligase
MARGAAVLAPHGVGVGTHAAERSAVGYWPGTLMVVYTLLLVVAVRLHEFIPFIGVFKPVLVVGLVGPAMIFMHASQAAKQAVLAHRISRLVLAYWAWVALTVPFALWPSMAFNTWKGLISAVLMVIAIVFCPPTRGTLHKLMTAFVVFVLIYAAYAQVFGRSIGGRLEIGGMYDSNDMASLMAIAFPMAAGMLTRSVPGRARVAAILAVLALGLGVMATGSRGGVLALLAGAVVFALGFRGFRGVVVIACLALGGVVGWATASPEFRARMNTLTNLEDDYNLNSEAGRKAVWRRGRGYIADNPVIGVGAGNFPMAEGEYLSASATTGKWSTAHNAYIQAYAELGVIGGSLFVGMLLLGVRCALPMWRTAPPRTGRAPPLDRPELLAALAAFAAGGYFLSHAYFGPLFALLGFIAVADRVRSFEATAPRSAAPSPASIFRQPGERGGLAFQLRSAVQPRGI